MDSGDVGARQCPAQGSRARDPTKPAADLTERSGDASPTAALPVWWEAGDRTPVVPVGPSEEPMVSELRNRCADRTRCSVWTPPCGAEPSTLPALIPFRVDQFFLRFCQTQTV